MVADQYACLLEDLEPKLAAAGIRRLNVDELTPEQDSTSKGCSSTSSTR